MGVCPPFPIFETLYSSVSSTVVGVRLLEKEDLGKIVGTVGFAAFLFGIPVMFFGAYLWSDLQLGHLDGVLAGVAALIVTVVAFPIGLLSSKC